MTEDKTRAELRHQRRIVELADEGEGEAVRDELLWYEASRCGARARSRGGRPCRAAALESGRCKNHGGLSSGPTSRRGRLESLLNLRPFQHLRSVPREQAERELAHLLCRSTHTPSPRPPKRPPTERKPTLVELVRRIRVR